ncbi:MAG: hypothetical protein AB1942_11365 [Pseudomonadota bacterium]
MPVLPNLEGKTSPSPVHLLFSGGRDSSLAACLLLSHGLAVHLLTGRSGTESGGELTELRLGELRAAFPHAALEHSYMNTTGMFREIAIRDIEQDFAAYRHNMILVGAKIALIAEGILSCLAAGATRLADGSAGYQSDFGEQRRVALSRFGAFCSGYGISFVTPVAGYESELEVKRHLTVFGMTSKSLEATSIFGDSFSRPSDEVVAAYIDEKIAVARQLIALRLGDRGLGCGLRAETSGEVSPPLTHRRSAV